jgi:hypothetical protein
MEAHLCYVAGVEGIIAGKQREYGRLPSFLPLGAFNDVRCRSIKSIIEAKLASIAT